MDFIIEFIGEILFQFLFELLGVLFDGGSGASARFGVVLRLVLYLILGVVLGALSVMVWPHPIYGQLPNPVISLVLVPLAVGAATVAVSRAFERKWNWDSDISRFGYSYFLAFVFAATRFSLL